MMATIGDASALPVEVRPQFGALEGQIESLKTHGARSAQRVARLRKAIHESYFQPDAEGATLDRLKELLEVVNRELAREEWSDRARAHVIFHLAERIADAPNTLDYVQSNIETWLQNHVNDGPKVALCLGIVPPDGITVQEVLASGAHKQVFVARWPEVTSLPVALKHFKPNPQDRGRGRPGDAFPHPLRGHHPNIIETFVVSEDKESGEVFLVERLLSHTLKDGWDFGGLGEIVNLIRDIANALCFVHGQSHMHGDIKLDNMGIERGAYILLDFGLCRPEATPDNTWTPTGNLRTRAPELLREGKPNSAASDVWALGAVAFQALVGHPPFFNRGERQSGFVGSAREEKIKELAERADPDQWESRVAAPLGEHVEEHSLGQLLKGMLAVDPSCRPPATDVVRRCDALLGWLLRPAEPSVELPPAKELEQLDYLRSKGDLSRAGFAKRLDLGEAIERLGEAKLSPGERDRLSAVEAALG
jgi:serine/threonine protein kinase